MSQVILPWSDVVSVEPTLEPITVAEAKRNSDVVDDDRDIDFRRWIAAARVKVETDARMCLVTQTRVRKMDCLPPDRFIVLNGPLASVTSVEYKDTADATQTYASSNYTVDTARNAVIKNATATWPTVGDAPNVLTVTYVCGKAVASVDERARHAVYLLVKHWWENPSAYVDSTQFEVPMGYSALVDQLRGGAYP